MFCDKCGAENPDDGAFCQKCGASLTASAPAKKKAAKKASPGPKAANSSNIGFSLPIPQILFFGSFAVLAIGILYGIIAAVGADDIYDSGTMAFAEFLRGLIYGIVGASVMLGLHSLITRD